MTHLARHGLFASVVCFLVAFALFRMSTGGSEPGEPRELPGALAEAELRRLPPVGESMDILATDNSGSESAGEAMAVSYLAPIAAVAAAATGANGQVTLQEVKVAFANSQFVWRDLRVAQTIIAPNTSVTLKFEGLTGRKIHIRNAKGEFATKAGTFEAVDASMAVPLENLANNELTLLLENGLNTLAIADVTGVTSIDVIHFSLIATSNASGRPTLSSYSNNMDKETLTNVGSSVQVFGQYLRLTGQLSDYSPDSELQFLLFDESRGNLAVRSEEQPVIRTTRPFGQASGSNSIPWDVVLHIPQQHAGFRGRLLPLHRKGNQVSFDSVLTIVVGADRPFSPPPVIQTVDFSPKSESPSAFQTRRSATGDAFEITDAEATVRVRVNTRLPDSQDACIRVYELKSGSRTGAVFKECADQDPAGQNNDGSWFVETSLKGRTDGVYQYAASIVRGDTESELSEPVRVILRTKGPVLRSIEPPNLLFGPGEMTVTLHFNPESPLLDSVAGDKSKYTLAPSATAAASAFFNPTDNSVTLTFPASVSEGKYRLVIHESVHDRFGHAIQSHAPIELVKSSLIGGPSVAPGISHTTGPYVPFHEFTGPRESTSGFNPNDKVETRVARLYYYRDAHRVAQIINRKVKSYNRQAVDMARQLADRARQEAERRTRARQAAEREAIRKAEETRGAERDLQAAEQQFAEAARDLNRQVRQGTTDPQQQRDVASLEELVRRTGAQVDRLRSTVQQLRAQEAQANEQAQVQEALEQAAVADQFRQEVAAAAADPDTFAPGVPDSYDPVEQVSVSVIGEGLIHLRGPLKGINIIRTMIDQIDTPMGQVRVSVHTVQINGEREQRMEVVANRIQRYIDQARFLTLQCGEMLRRAVVQVAARKAEEARALYPESTQAARDQRYLYAFFGEDFVEELRSLDSEFLRTGNKLLSLHSMDTTSLSSALTLMALARNSTRQEILAEFDQMLATELPAAEARNLEAGMAGCESDQKGGCKEPPPFYPLAQNARFESLRAFFNGEIGHDDTMTPLQREFIRLAQILKSRLITELEYKQRVTERAIIEELLGNRLEELRAARTKEEKAKQLFEESQKSLQDAQVDVVRQVALINAQASVVRDRAAKYSLVVSGLEGAFNDINRSIVEQQRKIIDDALVEWTPQLSKKDLNLPVRLKSQTEAFLGQFEASRKPLLERVAELDQRVVDLFNPAIESAGGPKKLFGDKRSVPLTIQLDVPPLLGNAGFQYSFQITPDNSIANIQNAGKMAALLSVVDRLGKEAVEWIEENLALPSSEAELFDKARSRLGEVTLDDRSRVVDNLLHFEDGLAMLARVLDAVSQEILRISYELQQIRGDLNAESVESENVLYRWHRVREAMLRFTKGRLLNETVEPAVRASQRAFDQLLDQLVRLNMARKNALDSRRPLDHKKFLDQLIDDLEEKFIELLEGTRAHTANIDNYLKRLTTALDDDFNTQFYFPTFRFVREASTYWDVQFGQTETTSILANNRQFAKVLPGATMEFDLPARDILLVEAVNGAKALIDDVGALANDPTFLAAARLQGPFSTASPPRGTTNGLPPERNVLSGLSTDTAERLLAQNSGSQNQFGANLENLIPDPAIYKFETGTGYEIRPVIQPDGQAVVFDFNYLYTTNVREPVRADEKHLGRVKRHFIHTDVQLSNFELREVSRYQVALKAARTSRGVPLFEDVPVVGVLFRPLPSQESSLQQNLVMAQATIFPTLFDLMGLRWAPVVADVDPMQLSNREFIVRGRQSFIQNRVYDEASSQVDHFLRIPESLRRPDLYRSQYTIPRLHPNGYNGAGLDYRDSTLQEGYQPNRLYPQERFAPPKSQEGAPFLPHRNYGHPSGTYVEEFPVQDVMPRSPDPRPLSDPDGRGAPSATPGAAAPGRWTPTPAGGQPGLPAPGTMPPQPSMNAPLPASGGPQFPQHQPAPLSVLVPAQGHAVTPAQPPQQTRQAQAAQMSSRASRFQPGSQNR